MDVLFPSPRRIVRVSREISKLKYATGLGRSAIAHDVDKEGEVVWMQEYIRYRINGCDHDTALTRVLSQIDGAAASGICAAPPENRRRDFPPRKDVFEMRRVLELKYQQMGRGLQLVDRSTRRVPASGFPYLRYRTNACDHVTSVSKVFTQIDGGPVPATCFVQACAFALNPGGIDSSYLASTQSFEVRPNPGAACDWTGNQRCSWLTIPARSAAGNDFTVVPYNIAVNNDGARTGRIRVAWTGGSATYIVNQAGDPVRGELHDHRSVPRRERRDRVSIPGVKHAVQFHRVRQSARAATTSTNGRPTTSMGSRRQSPKRPGARRFLVLGCCGANRLEPDGPTVPTQRDDGDHRRSGELRHLAFGRRLASRH